MSTALQMALVLTGAVLCLGAARWLQGGAPLARVLLGTLAFRVLLATGFFLISTYTLPVFRSLQLPGGFWRFAPDALTYHHNGVRIAAALAVGDPWPPITTVGGGPVSRPVGFFFYVGGLYRLGGAHPLHVPLVNAVLGVGAAAIAYVLACRLGGQRAGLLAALAIGCWPSDLVWSSQVLKDPLVNFLTLAALDLIVRLWATRGVLWLPLGALAAVTVALLADNRPHVVAALAGAVALALLGGAVAAARAIRVGTAVRGAVLLALVSMPALVAGHAPWQPPAATVDAPARDQASRPVGTESPLPSSTGTRTEVLRRAGRILADPVPALDRFRAALVVSGGQSLFAADARFANWGDVGRFLPHAVGYALYYPPPWQWVTSGETGAFRMLAGIEALAVLALTPLFLLSVWDTVRARRFDAGVLLLFAGLLLGGLTLAVPNAGTLFRLRLQALGPLIVLAAAALTRRVRGWEPGHARP